MMNTPENTIFELDEFDYQSPLGSWLQSKTEETTMRTVKRNTYKPVAKPQDVAYKAKTKPERHECYDQFGDASDIVMVRLRHSTMQPFNTNNYVWITNRALANDAPETTDFSINAQFLNDYLGYNINQGISYVNGEVLEGGMSQPGSFYIAQDRNGAYSFGLGDPPEDSWNAVGGARPLIIDGMPYGEGHRYAPGCTSPMPLSGEVPEESLPFLIQRNAAYFPDQNMKSIGKMVVAHNSSTNEIMIVAQEDGADGFLLDTIRNNLAFDGYDNALAFDGSTSSMLVKDDKVLIDPGNFKDWTLNSGITFSVPCK